MAPGAHDHSLQILKGPSRGLWRPHCGLKPPDVDPTEEGAFKKHSDQTVEVIHTQGRNWEAAEEQEEGGRPPHRSGASPAWPASPPCLLLWVGVSRCRCLLSSEAPSISASPNPTWRQSCTPCHLSSKSKHMSDVHREPSGRLGGTSVGVYNFPNPTIQPCPPPLSSLDGGFLWAPSLCRTG